MRLSNSVLGISGNINLDYPTLPALQLEMGNLTAILKTKWGSIKAAKISLLEQHREHAKLGSQINAARQRIERDALKDVRAKWLENVDHEEIKQQMRGEAPSTFACVKPQLGCPRR